MKKYSTVYSADALRASVAEGGGGNLLVTSQLKRPFAQFV